MTILIRKAEATNLVQFAQTPAILQMFLFIVTPPIRSVFGRLCQVGERYANCQDTDIDVESIILLIFLPGSCSRILSAGSMHLSTPPSYLSDNLYMKPIHIC